jgi:hypothetical protein
MIAHYPNYTKNPSQKECVVLYESKPKCATNKSLRILKELNEEALKKMNQIENTPESANFILNKLITFQKSPLSRDKKEGPKFIINGSWSSNKCLEHCSSNQETAETMKASAKASSINQMHRKYIARNTSLIKNRRLLTMLNS